MSDADLDHHPDPRPVLASDGPVTLLGGGHLGDGDLALALALAPRLVAADGGADAALARGLVPEAVVGDMDSLSAAAALALAPRLHRIAEQDTTDFDKALTRIAAPAVVAVGFSGGRLDHELAALHSLVLRAERACVLLGPATLALHAPPALALDLAPGTPVSLFPFAPLGVAATGLRWPTDGLRLAPDARVGTSNEALGPVALRPEAPGLLVILPRGALAPALAALLAAPRWPPRARGG